MTEGDVLTAPLVIEYPFKRTTGPVVGAFMTGLREGYLVGIKGSDGRVLVPPTEYDPVTGDDLTDLVDVGPAGTVTTWAWVRKPMPKHPLDRPFAWALITPDGGDTPMLGAVDAGSIDAMSTGMRVEPVWREEREGSITDLAHWQPTTVPAVVDGGNPPTTTARTAGEGEVEPVRSVRTPAELAFTYTPGAASSRYLRGLAERKIIGERAEPGARVYVPPRGADPQLGKPTTEPVEVAHTGTVTSFCVVNVSFYGGTQEIPYVTALIKLDRSDLPIMHLIQECPVEQVRPGMRVEAAWVDDADLGPTMESIRYFRPTGEPDVDIRIPGEDRPLWLDSEEFNRP